MPVINFNTDVEARTITITAQFAAPVERVWAMYADPRQLERVWGPPTHPATFVDHEMVVGARTTYFMSGPDGERYAGWWRITAVDAPHRFAFDDGFADDDFNEVPDLPISHNDYVFTTDDADGAGTRAVFTTSYDSVADIEKVLEMGMEEGATAAMGQIDDFLAAH